MNLYEITAAIESMLERALDTDTGEIIDEALDLELDELEADRDKRALHIAAAIVDYDAEAEKIAERARALGKWAGELHAKAERLKRYLGENLPQGHKVQDDRVRIGWRTSTGVVLDVCVDELPREYVRVKREPALGELATALKANDPVAAACAHLETRHNVQVR
jgi:seryl-tRNA synthetase